MKKLLFALCASSLISNSHATVRQEPPLKDNNERARLEDRRKLELLERQIEIVRRQLEENNKKYRKTIEEHLANNQRENK